MATTTNYSWSTPDDTALVKDGAAAIRSLGSAIDSTVFTNASAAISKTIVDAKGDIIAATAADTVSRLAVGANDTVLTADSTAATGLKWATAAAGGMTLLSTTTISGTTTTISSINQTYKDLYITAQNVTCTANFDLRFRTNAASECNYVQLYSTSSSAANTIGYNDSFLYLGGSNVGAANKVLAAGGNNSFALTIFDYASTTSHKTFSAVSLYRESGSSFNLGIQSSGGINTNSAITEVAFSFTTSLTGGTVKIYGVK